MTDDLDKIITHLITFTLGGGCNRPREPSVHGRSLQRPWRYKHHEPPKRTPKHLTIRSVKSPRQNSLAAETIAGVTTQGVVERKKD